jgi:hypothetical protein
MTLCQEKDHGSLQTPEFAEKEAMNQGYLTYVLSHPKCIPQCLRVYSFPTSLTDPHYTGQSISYFLRARNLSNGPLRRAIIDRFSRSLLVEQCS